MAQNLSGDVMSATLQPETKNEVEYVIELDFFFTFEVSLLKMKIRNKKR